MAFLQNVEYFPNPSTKYFEILCICSWKLDQNGVLNLVKRDFFVLELLISQPVLFLISQARLAMQCYFVTRH